MRNSRRAFLATMCGAGAAALAGAARPKRPNIVFILADDMGYGDAACFNPESRIPTPSIDRLAAGGMRFTDAHSPAAWCVPSRWGLLTGRYPLRNARRVEAERLIEPGCTTIASYLKQNGYATAMVGKWHLGFDGGTKYDFSRPLAGGPLDCGFDSFFGLPASLDIPPYFYIRGRRAVAAPTGRVAANHTEGWSRIQGAMWREGGIAPGFRHAEVLPRLEEEAVGVIDRHAASGTGKPLFLYAALTAPHTPWLPLPEYRNQSRAGLYGDFVVQVDRAVGRIMAALERNGMTEDTLVIFTSDNGPVWYDSDVQRLGHRSTGPLRGMKGDSWEGGHRVPFISRWPGMIRSGSVSRQTICFTDVMATLADMLREPLPAGAGEDSVSFLPALVGGDGGRPIRDHLVLKEGAAVIRQGDWKLITHLGSGGFSRPARIEPVAGGPRGQLYNLADDIGETRNLWLKYPEIVARMTELLRPYREAREAVLRSAKTPPAQP